MVPTLRPSDTHEYILHLWVPKMAIDNYCEMLRRCPEYQMLFLDFPLVGAFQAPTQFQREHCPAFTIPNLLADTEAFHESLNS